MVILGISAFYHDSAAALIRDGVIIAAAQEERFTRVKHDKRFPEQAVAYCLQSAGIASAKIDAVVFYEKPFLKFERLLETYLAFAPRGFSSFSAAIPIWVKEKLFQKTRLRQHLESALGKNVDWAESLLFSEHHLSHAASAFYPSPFDRAAVLTVDGVGEWGTTAAFVGAGSDLECLREIHFPHSLGLLYSAFTYYTGFKVNSGEYKAMGLAPYGSPRFAELIMDRLIEVRPDGSFRLNMDYFDYGTGLTMTNRRFDALFGGPPRKPESDLTQKEMDLAASIQRVAETVLGRLARDLSKTTGERNLCLAGGVALNCVANSVLLRDGHFENIWIQPAAGDAGGAAGAALAAYHQHFKSERLRPDRRDGMQGAFLGPSFGAAETEATLKAEGAHFERLSTDDMIDRAATLLSQGAALGWMQGRMEFGPRALGARSILADPRCPDMHKRLNKKIKFRESFRPFAPSVLAEHATQWFDLSADSQYMLFVARVSSAKPEAAPVHAETPSMSERLGQVISDIPSVTHVDGTARVQTVHKETNPLFHKLITRFFELTGCPVLVNTSFNIRGEPIVCTPKDAFRCFMGTELDALVIGDFLLSKTAQDPPHLRKYEVDHELD